MRTLKPDIYTVGAIDFDARLFDRLIHLPDGTSYNAYLVKGSEKTALFDTVDPAMTEVLFSNIEETGIEKIDYIVVHHAEQDHSGSIPAVLEKFPGAMVVTNPKCKDMLVEHLCIDSEKCIAVEDGHELSLGNKTVRFIYTPWVHWPETMSTYIREDRVLFSCDFFGAHLATSDLYADNELVVYESAKRYYAEIMMPFRKQVNSNIKKLEPYEIELICPSHGPVHRKPSFIIDAYKDWASDEVKNEVIVAYVSMHGSTAKMVSYFVNTLIERNIGVKQFELSTVDIGKLAMALVDAATIVIGTPTVLVGPHPCAAYGAFLANALRPKTKFASVIGSYGWAGKSSEQLTGMLTSLKAEILEPVMLKGYPRAHELKALDKLADDILGRHRAIGIVD